MIRQLQPFPDGCFRIELRCFAGTSDDMNWLTERAQLIRQFILRDLTSTDNNVINCECDSFSAMDYMQTGIIYFLIANT